MSHTRGEAMAAIAAGAARLAAQSRGPGAMRPRVTPAVCLYSRVLIEIGQVDLPMVIGGLGFDGVDLSVEPGGHVPPEKAGNYLMPALEGFTGRGIDVPMITTALTSLEDKDAENVLGLASYIKVPFFRPGHWKFTGSPAIEHQLQERLAGTGAVAQAAAAAICHRARARPGTLQNVHRRGPRGQGLGRPGRRPHQEDRRAAGSPWPVRKTAGSRRGSGSGVA